MVLKFYWEDHVQKLDLTLNKLKEKGLKCNIERSFFGQTKIEYLGFYVKNDVFEPINRNIEEITNMKPSTSPK